MYNVNICLSMWINGDQCAQNGKIMETSFLLLCSNALNIPGNGPKNYTPNGKFACLDHYTVRTVTSGY